MSSDQISVDVEVAGAEEAAKSIESFVASLEGVEKASDIDLSPIANALDAVNESGKESSGVLEELAKAGEQVAPAFDAGTSSIENYGAAAQDAINTDSELAAGIMELLAKRQEDSQAAEEQAAVGQEFAASLQEQEASESAFVAAAEQGLQARTESTAATQEHVAATTEDASATQELSSAMTPLGGIISETAGSTGELNTVLVENVTQMNDVAAATTETNARISELGPIFSDAGTAAAGTTTSFNDLVGAEGALGEAVEAVQGPLTEQNTLMENLATTTPDATGAMQELGTASDQMGTSVETSAGSWKTLDSNMGSTIGFMGSAASGVIGLVTGFVRLEQAQNRVAASQLKVSRAQEALTKAQQKLNALRASGTASAEDLAQAELDVSQALEALEVAQGRAEIGQTNLNLRMADFYTGIGPQIIQTVTGIIAGVSQMPSAFSNIANSMGLARTSTEEFSVSADGASLSSQELGIDLGETEAQALGLGNGANQVTASVTGMGTGMSTAGKFASGLGIAAAAASAAILVISTNAFGARDALNAWGEALGNAIPPLEGLLVGVQNFAVDIGIAGDDAKAQVTNFQSLEEQIVSMGTSMETAGAQMETSASAMTSMAGGALKELGTQFKTSGSIIVTETSGWGSALDEFSAALGRQDWGTALDLLISGFESVGTVVVEALRIANAAIDVGMSTIIGAIQDFAFNAGNLILEGLGRIGASIDATVFAPIREAFGSAGAFIQQSVAKWVADFGRNIATMIDSATTVAQGIGDAFNSTVDFVTDQSQAIFDKLGITKLAQMAVNVANQIGKAIGDAVAGIGKAAGLAVPGPEQPTAIEEPETKAGKMTAAERDRAKAINAAKNEAISANFINERYNAILDQGATTSTNAGAVTANLTSRFAGLRPVTAELNSRFGESARLQLSAAAAASVVSARMADVGSNVALLNPAQSELVSNFQRAGAVMPGFSTALANQAKTGGELPPVFSAYSEALQAADNANVKIPASILKSTTATEAFGQALTSSTGEIEKQVGAASGYLAGQGMIADTVGMTGREIINYAAAVKAGKDETDRLTTGQQQANAAILGVQGAYATMTPQVLSQVVALQKEAQSLALGNILRADSTRATVALAEATTQGVQKGVEFANAQFTAQASLQGYRAALSQAIAGNTEYGNSLGLTTGQLERQLSFTNDVVKAQEAIIDSVAEQNNAFEVNAAAWNTMTDAQLANLNEQVNTRIAQEGLRDSFAATNENILAQKMAFAEGVGAAKDYAAEIAASSAAYEGFRTGLIQSLGDLNKQTGVLNQAIGTHHQYATAADGSKVAITQVASEMDILNATAGRTNAQIQELVSAFAAAPESIMALTEAVGGLVDSFIGLLEFQGDEDEIFGDFDLGDKVPKEFERVLNDSQLEWAEGQAQLQRQAEMMGPAIGVSLGHAMATMDLTSLQETGPRMAEELRSGWDGAVPPVVEHMAQTFEKLGTIGDTITQQNIGAFTGMATSIIQDLNMMANPMEQYVQQLIDMGTQANLTGEALGAHQAKIATMAGGLEGLSHAGESASLTLGDVGTKATGSQVPIVKLTDAASGATTTFANINGQLVPVNTGLSDLVGPAQLAGNALLGIGAFANAAVIRFGDVKEGLVGLSNTMGSFITIMGAHTTTLTTYFGTTIPVAFMATQNAMVQFTTMFVQNFAILIAQMGAHVTTLNTYFTTTIPMAFMASQNALVMFTTMFVANFGILIAQMGLHVTTLNTYFLTTIPMAFMASQNAMVAFTTMFVANFALLIAQMGMHVITLQTYFQTTIPMVFMASQNAMVQFTTMFVANFAILIAQIGAHVTTLQTYFQTTIPSVFMASQNAMVAFTSMFAANMATLISALGQHVTTINTYFSQTIPQAMQAASSAVTQHTTAMGTAVLTFRNNVQQMAGDVSSSFEEVTSAASSMASGVTSSMNAASTSALTFRNNVQQTADDVSSACDEMTSAVESFADAFEGAMDQLVSSAEKAKQAVEEVQSAIDSLKDKTVTVTVNYKETGRPTDLQHGGSFIAGHPMKIDGVNIGEHHKPELVTVTPLTNPNRNYERSIDASRFMSAPTATTTGMQRGGTIVRAGGGDSESLFRSLIAEVRQMRMNFRDMKIMSTTVLDSQVIDQRIQQRRVRRTENFG